MELELRLYLNEMTFGSLRRFVELTKNYDASDLVPKGLNLHDETDSIKAILDAPNE